VILLPQSPKYWDDKCTPLMALKVLCYHVIANAFQSFHFFLIFFFLLYHTLRLPVLNRSVDRGILVFFPTSQGKVSFLFVYLFV
jgi:hypothetical protein